MAADSIPESTLQTNGWLDFEHQQEKTVGRRCQLLKLGRAVWAGGKMVEQCRLFSSLEYSSGQLSEVRFEALVGGCVWVVHREISATSAVGDDCVLYGQAGCNSTGRNPLSGECSEPNFVTEPSRCVGVFRNWCSSQIPLASR
jgi:hypothetical protein